MPTNAYNMSGKNPSYRCATSKQHDATNKNVFDFMNEAGNCPTDFCSFINAVRHYSLACCHFCAVSTALVICVILIVYEHDHFNMYVYASVCARMRACEGQMTESNTMCVLSN